jgi:hypothetical protein
VTVDAQGNIYVVGGTASKDFPTTPRAFDQSFDSDGSATGDAGDCDAFVMKYSPAGELLWSTYLGGPNYDRAYGVKVDDEGFVYVAGRCGPEFPITPRAFQPEFMGQGDPFYGRQNSFVAKLKPDGSGLAWSSYVGHGTPCRDLDLDPDGNICLPLVGISNPQRSPSWYADAFSRAFQPKPSGGTESGVAKVSNDGSKVLWATWLGGSRNEVPRMSIRVDGQGAVCVCFDTNSSDMPTTDDAHDRKLDGPADGYVAKISSDGSRLLFGTYLGGARTDAACNTHNLALDSEGNVYLSCWTNSTDFPTTENAFDRTYRGMGDIAVVKLSPSGRLLASTFLGASAADESEGIDVDPEGNVLVTGRTKSPDFPVTAGAIQTRFGGGEFDGIVVKLSADLGRLLYASFMGGRSYEFLRASHVSPDGHVVAVGSSNGSDWPVKNAHQQKFAGTNDARWGNGDAVLLRLEHKPQ